MGNCTNQRKADPPNADAQPAQKKVMSSPANGQSKLVCPESHQLSTMCITKTCPRDALYCSHPTCTSTHPRCQHVQLSEVSKLIEKRLDENQQFILSMQNMEKDLVQAVRERMKTHLSRVLTQTIDKKYSLFIDAIYYKRMGTPLLPAEAGEFLTQMQESDRKRSELQTTMLARFKRELEGISQALTDLEGTVINQYVRQSKICLEQSTKAITEPPPKSPSEQQSRQQRNSRNQKMRGQVERESMLHSSIVMPQKVSQIQSILQALDHPKSIQLVFRASEHAFRAAAFHQICDNIQNTLVIMATEYGRTIVGYTPLPWNSSKGFAMDQTGKSFLLALELNKKLSLVRAEKTIQCVPSYGPVFGGGSDIAISDCCDTSRKSCTNFPYSFNCNDEFAYGQQSWKALCGVEEGKYFNVLEYEVFKVCW